MNERKQWARDTVLTNIQFTKKFTKTREYYYCKQKLLSSAMLLRKRLFLISRWAPGTYTLGAVL